MDFVNRILAGNATRLYPAFRVSHKLSIEKNPSQANTAVDFSQFRRHRKKLNWPKFIGVLLKANTSQNSLRNLNNRFSSPFSYRQRQLLSLARCLLDERMQKYLVTLSTRSS